MRVFQKKSLSTWSVLIICLAILGCSPSFETQPLHQPSQIDPITPPPQNDEILDEEPIFDFEPLLWETKVPSRRQWSEWTFEIITTKGRDLLFARDLNVFCKNYDTLSELEKINVLGQLISAIVKYESNFHPLTRFQESSMGIDPITNEPVWSEGLMQLSYQDVRGHKYCNLNWDKDKNLSRTDPQKSILDPFINLECGIQILNTQVKRHGKIVISQGAYWAVIKENSQYQKIEKIKTDVNSLSLCQPRNQ